ncbi:hypothetical protein [Paenibacillus arenilitoris]|uniref:Uncharacterized protein n=1 Tax=Paenibacillus arenilitoris TaxID=2772299 RepID=A0A927CHY5_9BACL|nr:hypothetical protein [Paenibacillus arenilitoris]MBD2866977.1 hypothetical protein [Paenibacillus arenilitoris]
MTNIIYMQTRDKGIQPYGHPVETPRLMEPARFGHVIYPPYEEGAGA